MVISRLRSDSSLTIKRKVLHGHLQLILKSSMRVHSDFSLGRPCIFQPMERSSEILSADEPLQGRQNLPHTWSGWEDRRHSKVAAIKGRMIVRSEYFITRASKIAAIKGRMIVRSEIFLPAASDTGGSKHKTIGADSFANPSDLLPES